MKFYERDYRYLTPEEFEPWGNLKVKKWYIEVKMVKVK